MQSGPPPTNAALPATMVTELPQRQPRVRLKPMAPTSGFVDGAWWPRSRDLTIELQALLSALTPALDRIERVTYNLAAWDPAPRRLTADSGTVRLDGFHSQHPDIVTVTGTGGRRRLTLLTVAPDTVPASARIALMAATQHGNTDSIEALLASTAVGDGTGAATQRWEADGGRLDERLQSASPGPPVVTPCHPEADHPAAPAAVVERR